MPDASNIWRVENSHNAVFSISDNNLVFTALGGSKWDHTTDTAPKILQQIDFHDDFSVEARLLRSTLNCGAFIVKSSINAAVSFSYGTFGLLLKQLTTTGWQNITNQYLSQKPPLLDIRLEKQGNLVRSYYKSSTATAWAHLYDFLNLDYKNAYAGFYVYTPQNSQHSASFSHFRFYGSRTFTAGSIIHTKGHDFGRPPAGKGFISWKQDLPSPGCRVEFYTQTTNDPDNWSEPWQGPYTDNIKSEITSLTRRYIRFMA
ncbi:MAG TPA: hypothetical protein ENN43_06315, partial [bacterium]|nr:hypothetical protein [bacterium]